MYVMLAVAESGEPIRVQLISLGVGTILPLVVGLVTKASTSSGAKALWLAALSAASGFLTELGVEGDGFMWSTALITWGGTFIVGVGSHFGLLKPTGLTAQAQGVGNR